MWSISLVLLYRQQATAKKATMGNVMNNMMRHKRLEGGGPNTGTRPQVSIHSVYFIMLFKNS